VEELGTKEEGRPNCSPAGTYLRTDLADACSLGRNGERYFLLVVDKDTEYLANLIPKVNTIWLTCCELTSPRKFCSTRGVASKLSFKIAQNRRQKTWRS
jgi:hypothetical protein